MLDSLILFPRYDKKYENWSAALKVLGIATSVCRPYRLSFFLMLFVYRVRVRNLFFVFRYMNARRSLLITSLQAAADGITVFCCKALGIRIIWFLHNVDQETYDYFPKVTRLRRHWVSSFCDAIIVMDELLVSEVKARYPDKVVDHICFGEAYGVSKFAPNTKSQSQILSWVEARKKADPDLIFCLSANSPSPKNETLQFISRLVRFDAHNQVHFVIVGECPDDISELDCVLHVRENFDVSKSLMEAFDVVAKVSTDRSVLLTGYNAAYANVALITDHPGFFSEFVEYYELGVVRSPDENRSEFLNRVRIHLDDPNRHLALERFRSSHNWQISAQQLCAVVGLNKAFTDVEK